MCCNQRQYRLYTLPQTTCLGHIFYDVWDQVSIQTGANIGPTTILNDIFWELLLIILSSKIAQMDKLRWTKGLPEL